MFGNRNGGLLSGAGYSPPPMMTGYAMPRDGAPIMPQQAPPQAAPQPMPEPYAPPQGLPSFAPPIMGGQRGAMPDFFGGQFGLHSNFY